MLLVCATGTFVCAEDTGLVLGAQNGTLSKMGAAVLSEACSRLDVPVEFRVYPPRRTLKMVVEGKIDGMLLRTEGVLESSEGVVRVPVPLCRVRLFAFAGKEYPIRTWEDLAGLRIGFLRGLIHVEQKTEGMTVHPCNSQEKMMFLLGRGRIDVAVLSELNGLAAIERAGLEGVVRPVGEPLEDMPLYTYLNKRRSELVPKLAEVLRQMEQSGEAEAIRVQVLGQGTASQSLQ